MATRKAPARKLAQAGSNQVAAPTTMPTGRPARTVAPIANYPSAGQVPAKSSARRYAPGGELGAMTGNGPSPLERVALDGLNGGRTA